MKSSLDQRGGTVEGHEGHGALACRLGVREPVGMGARNVRRQIKCFSGAPFLSQAQPKPQIPKEKSQRREQDFCSC